MDPAPNSPECFGQNEEEEAPELPKCSQWRVWTGFEIEGTEDISVQTLFIRALVSDKGKVIPPISVFNRARESGIRRVWFCEEFSDVLVIADACAVFERVCWCIDPTNQHAQHLHMVLDETCLKKIRFYLKLGELFKMRQGDFVCFGPKYNDTAYPLQLGSGVTPDLYEDDVKWF